MRSPLGRAAEPVPCVRCDRREPGLAWGEYCSVCREERDKAANRVARRIAILGAALMGFGLFRQGLVDFKTRVFGAAAVVLVYLILRRLVSRGILEYRRSQDVRAAKQKQP
jgi:hypothetical protein